MKQVVGEIMAPLLTKRRHIGLVVGVSDEEKHLVFGYGEAQDDSGRVPDGDTLFEIGSVTKTFTGLLLAMMVNEGMVSLDDGVCDLVPELSHLPPEMTLLRLATHTAGLPFLPFHPIPYLLKGPHNLLADFTSNDLLEVVSKHQPKEALPPLAEAKVHYSNVGLGLLDYALAQTLGTTYEEAIISRICDKLGMFDTRVSLTPSQREGLATPHSPRGKRTLNWDMPGLVGAGALRSTANDMLRYLAGQVEPDSGIGAEVRRICHRIYVAMPPTPQRGLVAVLLRWLVHRLGMETDYESVGMALAWPVVQAQGGGVKFMFTKGNWRVYGLRHICARDRHRRYCPAQSCCRRLRSSVPCPPVSAIGFRVLRKMLQDKASG